MPTPLAKPPSTSDSVELLAHLESRFSVFRRNQQSGRKLPTALRRAVLDALAKGISTTAVRQACGVTNRQLMLWHRADKLRTIEPIKTVSVSPRVLPVLESPETKRSANEVELDMRVGPWCLSLRLDAPR
jgi:hypothetical protein